MYARTHRLPKDNELALGKEIQLPIISDQSYNAKNTIYETKLQNRRKPPSRTPIQSGLAPYHHPSSIPNRNVCEMLLRHQRDRNYKRQGPSMTDKQERQEAVIAETWRRSPPRSKQYLARDPACARDLAIRSLRRTGGRVLP
jgi:hypothetical protein